jgi:hypothetical protein
VIPIPAFRNSVIAGTGTAFAATDAGTAGLGKLADTGLFPAVCAEPSTQRHTAIANTAAAVINVVAFLIASSFAINSDLDTP